MLDNEEVNIGDAVFVLGLGYGTVTSISADGSFRVKLKGAVQEFRNGGYIGSVRKVFWHDPVFIVPPKNASLWATVKEQTKYNYDLIRKILRAGGVIPEDTSNESSAE